MKLFISRAFQPRLRGRYFVLGLTGSRRHKLSQWRPFSASRVSQAKEHCGHVHSGFQQFMVKEEYDM